MGLIHLQWIKPIAIQRGVLFVELFVFVVCALTFFSIWFDSLPLRVHRVNQMYS